MDIQVFYYTRTGRSEKIAKKIAAQYSVSANKIEEDTSYKGVFGFIKGGAKAAKKEVVSASFAPIEDGKTIVLVYPVWANNFPPAVNSFFESCPKERVILIPTSLTTKIKERDGFIKVIDLIGKDIDDIPIDLEG